MTNAEPTPVVHRFPWAQLVFCLACLAMTAWTWMRFSYAWDVTPNDLFEANSPLASGGWEEFYVRLHGVALGGMGRSNDVQAIAVVQFIGSSGKQVIVITKMESPLSLVGSVAGRVMPAEYTPIVDTRLSRFTGASVAGLVVGAMGCFILGLYLRAWLRERKALASEPPQDTIN